MDLFSWLNDIPESEAKSAVQSIGRALLYDHLVITVSVAAACVVRRLVDQVKAAAIGVRMPTDRRGLLGNRGADALTVRFQLTDAPSRLR